MACQNSVDELGEPRATSVKNNPSENIALANFRDTLLRDGSG
jgi:hypothetical protein